MPLGLSRFDIILSNVFLAISAYSLLPVARLNWPNAIVAKVYEKILYGSTSGLPSRVSEKYQL